MILRIFEYSLHVKEAQFEEISKESVKVIHLKEKLNINSQRCLN